MMNDSYGFGSFRNKIWLKHSKTLSVKIDYDSKIINFKQNKPGDWVSFVDVNMSQWKILFEGVKPAQNKGNINIERINNHGLTGCLNFYQSFLKELLLEK